MAEPITLDELLAEFNRLDQKQAVQGYTFRELKEKVGYGEEKMKDLIRRGISEGLIKSARAGRMAIDGTMRPVPVYAFVPPVKPKGKVRAS